MNSHTLCLHAPTFCTCFGSTFITLNYCSHPPDSMEATPTVEDVIRPLNLWFSDAISRAVADNQVHGGQSALPFALGGIRNFFQIIVVEATKQHKYTEEMRSVLESLQIELELEQRFSHGNTTALERSTRVLENRVKECERRFGEAVQETAIHADRVKMLETALTKANNKAVDQDIRIRTLEADLHSLLSLVRKHSQVTSIHSRKSSARVHRPNTHIASTTYACFTHGRPQLVDHQRRCNHKKHLSQAQPPSGEIWKCCHVKCTT